MDPNVVIRLPKKTKVPKIVRSLLSPIYPQQKIEI